MDLRQTAEDVLEGFDDHRLLTYASAIAYQVISSLIPFALFALALIGSIGAESLWTDHLRPDIAMSTSDEVLAVVDTTVTQILTDKQTFWVSLGLVVVLWQLGGAVRATMEAVDEIYAIDDRRGRREKYLTSTWLAGAVGALWLCAFVVLLAGRALVSGAPGAAARYAAAALLLMTATWLTLRFAPARRQPVRWIGIGSVVIVAGWLIVVGGYVLYASRIASYGSIFGALSSIFVLIVTAYLSAVVFLSGVLVDAKARDKS